MSIQNLIQIQPVVFELNRADGQTRPALHAFVPSIVQRTQNYMNASCSVWGTLFQDNKIHLHLLMTIFYGNIIIMNIIKYFTTDHNK